MLLGFELLKPRDYFTGTNSVATRSTVTELEPGKRLCVPRLDLPDGTARVRLISFGQGAGTVEGSVRTADGEFRSRSAAIRDGRRELLELDVPKRAGTAPATACVRAGGRLRVGGMAGLQSDDVPPTIDGAPLDARVAVFFLPERGEQASLIGRTGDILDRAALFRPGVLGPWLYALLLFAVLPAAVLLALWTLARSVAGAPLRPSAPVAVALVAFAAAGSWALFTPVFDAPDEPEHFAYAQYLAETGNAPDKTPGGRPDPFSTQHTVAVEGVRLYSHIESVEGRPPWEKVAEERWRKRDDVEPPLAQDNGGGYTVSAAGHSPPYYGLLAPAYAATQGGTTYDQLTLMRLVSALLGALAALFAYLTVRELLPRHQWAAVAAGMLVALHPMFGFMSGAVNNDMGVNAAAAALVYLLVRALRRGLTVWLAVAIGVMLVAAPLLKGTAYALYPAALLALAILLWRQRRSLDVKRWAALAGAFVAAQVLWILVSGAFDRTGYSTPGGNAPTAEGGVVGAAVDQPFAYLSYLWQFFLPRLPFMNDMHVQTWPAFNVYVEGGWASFGWYAKLFPRWVYVVIAATMLVVGALAIRALWLERERLRNRLAEIAVLAVATLGVFAAVHAAYFTTTPRGAPAEQGRYAFTAMVPLAVLAVAGTFGLGRKHAPLLAGVLVAATAVFAYASRWLAAGGFFA